MRLPGILLETAADSLLAVLGMARANRPDTGRSPQTRHLLASAADSHVVGQEIQPGDVTGNV
jgi:hypothetical protein